MKKSIEISLCIIGAFIGAGFATGKEISSFFVKYGSKSIIGICISSILFGVYVFAVLKKVKEEKISTPYEYLCAVSNSHFALFSAFITYIMLFVSFCVMITGITQIINDIFLIPYFLSSVFVSAVCCIIFLLGKTGIIAAGSFLTPIMILGMFALAFFVEKDATVFSSFLNNYLTSSVIYVSYNTLPLLAFIIALASEIKSKKQIFMTSLITTLIIFFTMSALWYVLSKFDGVYLFYDMPLLKISERYGVVFKNFYTIVLIFSMLTTAISSGTGLILHMDKKLKYPHNNIINPLILCVLSICMSFVGFSNFIDVVYPFFGYLGLSVFLIIFFDILRNLKKNREFKRISGIN